MSITVLKEKDKKEKKGGEGKRRENARRIEEKDPGEEGIERQEE